MYLLALTVYPCSDASTCAGQDSEKKVKTELTQHDHSEDEGDACTPFCICSCCAATIRLTTSDVTLVENNHYTLHIIPYTKRNVLNNVHTIWQPPKLA